MAVDWDAGLLADAMTLHKDFKLRLCSWVLHALPQQSRNNAVKAMSGVQLASEHNCVFSLCFVNRVKLRLYKVNAFKLTI